MPKKAATVKRSTRNAASHDSQREFLLAILNQAHLDFAALGKLSEAGPLLNELMGMAYRSPNKGAVRKTA